LAVLFEENKPQEGFAKPLNEIILN